MKSAAELIAQGFYFNRIDRPRFSMDSQSLSVKMGDRNPDTAKYTMETNSGGDIPSTFIGRSNSRPENHSTQIELGDGQNWGDS